MSWIQLHGQTWPVTEDEAKLRVNIQPPDVACPRVDWNLDVSHYPPAEFPVPKGVRTERWLDIELGGLIFNARDWRKLAGMEIRADAAWHATQEFIGPYGHCHNSPRVAVHQTILKSRAEHVAEEEAGHRQWLAHDFILRFGSRDGWSFPCELDAWLIPESKYYRIRPEPKEECTRFSEGPPNFRLVTRATFIAGSVNLTKRAADNPVAHARQVLVDQIGCDEMLDPEVQWMLRPTPGREESVRMPGWRSDVYFATPGTIG